MRDYQKIFFKTRDRRVMYRCIELEKQVDNAIEAFEKNKEKDTLKVLIKFD